MIHSPRIEGETTGLAARGCRGGSRGGAFPKILSRICWTPAKYKYDAVEHEEKHSSSQESKKSPKERIDDDDDDDDDSNNNNNKNRSKPEPEAELLELLSTPTYGRWWSGHMQSTKIQVLLFPG